MSYAPNSRAPKPDYDNLQQEPTGPVASDSLAADSIRADGRFAENEDAAPMSVRGANSTLANEDTSGASTLRAARDGTTRENQDFLGAGSDERGHSGLKYTGETEEGGNTDFGSNKPYNADAVSSSITAGSRPYVDTAPNYTARVSGAIQEEGQMKPKGQGLVEDDDLPEAKFSAIGSRGDPGRVAEEKFSRQNADSLDGVRGGGQYSGSSSDKNTGEGRYDALQR